jgi:hypothetical protein
MYREDKATQMAASFLRLANGRLNYLLLMKMLYQADKQKLLVRGKPITFDSWYSMKNGPALSQTLDLIRGNTTGQYWPNYIRTDKYDAVLTHDPGTDALSRIEDKIIADTFQEWGHLDPFAAAKLTHDKTRFPEYTDPGDGCIPIGYHEVLKLNGVPDDAISEILDNLESYELLKDMVGAR